MAKGIILEGIENSYKILISYNCQVDIEQHYNGESIFITMSESPTAKFIRLVVKYGLEYGEGKKVTLKETGEILDDIIAKHSFIYLQNKVLKALNNALGADNSAEEVVEPEGK